jgi:hypothetical protein
LVGTVYWVSPIFAVSEGKDGGAQRILAVGGDALLHLGRAETGVLPDDRNDWNVDLRKISVGIDRNAVTPKNRISRANT